MNQRVYLYPDRALKIIRTDTDLSRFVFVPKRLYENSLCVCFLGKEGVLKDLYQGVGCPKRHFVFTAG